jgi:chemotaxis protein methyltransferase CheR
VRDAPDDAPTGSASQRSLNTLSRFAALIGEVTGNVVPDSRHELLREIVSRRCRAAGFVEPAAYVEALVRGDLAAEWDILIPLVTIKESYFFRAPQQVEALRTELLPRLLRARASARHLRVWSAACARGEEPATLAMLLAEESGLAGWDWSILATDLDEEALGVARRGLYGERSVAQVPPALLGRYFHPRGRLFELDPQLRARIDYRTLNLAHPPFATPFREYDLILLRNILIYFPRALQAKVVGETRRLLAPKGFLFLGASETLWPLQEELEPLDLGSCFCYRRRRATSSGEISRIQLREAERIAARLPAATPVAGSSTQERRAAKAERRSRPTMPLEPPPAAPASSGPYGVHERLLAAARDLAADRISEATREIDGALAADPSEPAAHALEGFLHDLSGRTQEAVASYRAALYLDPALYQPRLLLADCLLRLGQRERAEHQYREVLATLGSGRERSLLAFGPLPLLDRERAIKRCRQALDRAGT